MNGISIPYGNHAFISGGGRVIPGGEEAMISLSPRKLAAILVSDVVGFSGADEERTLARLRALRSDLIDPTIC
jgi:hypothetical protein